MQCKSKTYSAVSRRAENFNGNFAFKLHLIIVGIFYVIISKLVSAARCVMAFSSCVTVSSLMREIKLWFCEVLL